MFIDPLIGPAPLAHDPLKAIVAPRPIGWITALNRAGQLNLSPYSFFNIVSFRPHVVMFSSDGHKDAVAFVEETGEFTCSLTGFAQREAMNMTSAPLPRGESEAAFAGLAMTPSVKVKPPRVAGAAAALECKLVSVQRIVDIDGVPSTHWMVLGQVVGMYLDDACVTRGRFDMVKAGTIARCGYGDYAHVTALFEMTRPPGGG
jgi:flavin reductase (DIM6/NTAB) family NADH-FMN oxidoreductase RutF